MRQFLLHYHKGGGFLADYYEEKGEWHYVSQMDDEGQDGAAQLFGILKVEVNSPL